MQFPSFLLVVKIMVVNSRVLCLIALFLVFLYIINRGRQLDQKFYHASDLFPELNTIYPSLDRIKEEIRGDHKEQWTDWPERKLYQTKNSSWKIIPFKAFGVTVKANCDRFPHLWDFIRSVPSVKIAILSKLGPGMKLKSHRGWKSHSNHVLRCHFGIQIPMEQKCYISVADDLNGKPGVEEHRYHSQDQWLVFDDSKHHYAENPTERERIVLIMDLERPSNVKPGTSKVQDSKELKDILESFR